MDVIKLLIADDQTLFRDFAQLTLSRQKGISIVDWAATGTEAVNKAKIHKPDVILMDIRMPELDGIEATKLIKKDLADTKIIILTYYEEKDNVFKAIEAGASGFLSKNISVEKLIEAIGEISNDAAFFDPQATMILIREFVKSKTPAEIQALNKNNAYLSLSEREKEILKLVAEGLHNNEISKRLFVSESTIKTYFNHIKKKLNLRDRLQVALFVLKHTYNKTQM